LILDRAVVDGQPFDQSIWILQAELMHISWLQ
jgi:hypothetical protein